MIQGKTSVWLSVLTAYKRLSGAQAGSAKVRPSSYTTLSETSAVLHASQNMTVHCSTFCSAPVSQDLKTSKIKKGLQPIPFMVRCGINKISISNSYLWPNGLFPWGVAGPGRLAPVSLLFITGRCLTEARYQLCHSEQSSQKIRWMCWATKLMLGQETEQMSLFIKGGFVSW